MKTSEQAETFENANCCLVSYDTVRQAMQGETFTMHLARRDGKIVEKAVNQGIDAHLEACYCPERGDKYDWQGGRLCCVISVESFPILVRRLFEMHSADGYAIMLADEMLHSLGINEYGEFVGREALGLE